ncbi:hypothetical protein D9M68_726820 [compost metagenome]
MKPTVSDNDTERPASPRYSWRVVVSSVANSWSAAYARALTRALKIEDLPALVYPTSDIANESRRSRWRRCVARCFLTFSRRSLVRLMLSPIMRRSSSIWVSPGPPRMPMPPL